MDENNIVATVFADGRGFAQYHLWEDGNPSNEDRSGYFVSVAPCTESGVDRIKICTGTHENAFGVTMPKDKAKYAFPGFIGGEVAAGNDDDNAYGLVCLLGHVLVRRAANVSIGDYVVPNSLGTATKSVDGLGYKVISLDDVDGEQYACINLVPDGNVVARIKDELNALEERVVAAESNAASAINRANEAYDLAELGSGSANVDLVDKINNAEKNSQDAKDMASGAQSTAEDVAQAVKDAFEAMDEARETANSAQETANIAKENIDATIQSVNDMVEGLTPITEWTNEDGESGAKYFVENVQGALEGTEAIIKTMEGDIKSAQSAIMGNAQSLQSVISAERKYVVGSYSQAYGLDLESAKNTLSASLVYVPTEGHTEIYGDMSQTFVREYSYKWTGDGWAVSPNIDVMFSSVYVTGSTSVPYWFTEGVNVKNGNITYPKDTLYVWDNDKWTAVATLGDNAVSTFVSSIQQTEDEVKTAIKAVDGGLVSLSARVLSNESRIEEITQWDGGEFGNALTAVQQKSNKNEASINSLAEFGTVTVDWVNDYQPTSGTFYKTAPAWSTNDNKWVFGGETSTSVTDEYCYAENTENTTTYLQYIHEDEKWTKATWKRSESLAQIQQRVTANTADISLLAEIVGDGESGSLASIQLQAEENAAKIASIVSNIGSDGVVTAASIIQSVNEDGSNVQIQADKINLTGAVTISSMSADTKINLIKSVQVLYALSDSMSVAPTANWSAVAPEYREGYYMWQKTIITYVDGHTAEPVATCIAGAKGADGKDGTGVTINGVAYIKDVTVDDTFINQSGYLYQDYNDGVYSNLITNPKQNDAYLVQGYLFVYSGNNDQFTCVGKIQGPAGAQGVGVSDVVDQYGLSDAPDTKPTDDEWIDITDGAEIPFDKDKYRWSRQKIVYTDGHEEYTAARFDEAGSRIAAWCSATDKTFIDGANIYSGTVTTEKLAAEAIQSFNWDYDDGKIFSNSGVFLDLQNGVFTSPHFTIDEAGSTYFAGELSAPTGTIGGFTISSSQIHTIGKSSFDKIGTMGVYIGTDGICVSGPIQVDDNFIGHDTYVSLDASTGKLTANNAEIIGKITATSGYIGTEANGFAISDGNIHSVYTYSSGAQGNTTVSAYMTSYNTLEPGTYVYYECVDKNFVYVGTDGIGMMHTALDAQNSQRVIDKQTYMAGGELFSNSAEITGKITATSGKIGDFEIDGALRANGLYNLNATTGNGIYLGSDGLQIRSGNNHSVKIDVATGTLHADNVNLEGEIHATSGEVGGWSIIDGTLVRTATTNDTGNPTWTFADNIVITHKEGEDYDTSLEFGWNEGTDIDIDTNKVYPWYGLSTNSSLVFKAGRQGRLLGTWLYNTSPMSTSWRGAKHDIEQLDGRYSILFDNLNPVRFKYNDGTSDRYHTGVVLDELKDAMDIAGVNSSEFAAYCVQDEETGEGGVRYEELIALLIKEVQALKKEIKEIKENE